MKYALILTLAATALALPLTTRQSAGEVSTLLPDLVDDVELILDGVGVTDTLSGLRLKKEKRQADALLKGVEDLLASGENEVLSTVDSTLGLDGIFPVSTAKRFPLDLTQPTDLIPELTSPLTSTISELGLPTLGDLEKRRDVLDFVDTVVVDAVGQVDTTLEAAPLLEGTVKEKRRDVLEFVDTVAVDAVGQVETTVEAAPLLEGTV